MGLAYLQVGSNPLSFSGLIFTIIFQVGVVGGLTLFACLFLLPRLAKKQGMHPILPEELESIQQNFVLRVVFRKAKHWYDHVWYSLASTGLKTAAFFILILTLFTLLTDVGWLDAWKAYGTDWLTLFLMARAGGTANGAHLISYIPLPLLGAYVAWKFRATSIGNTSLGDVYQGILIAAAGVAIHELFWIGFYLFQYYGVLGLYRGANFAVDLTFTIMCLMLFYAFWKYPFRTIKMRTLLWPSVIYFVFIFLWWALLGLPVTTVNNFQVGSGIWGITKWWADPLVNGIEIVSWVMIAVGFWVAIWRQER